MLVGLSLLLQLCVVYTSASLVAQSTFAADTDIVVSAPTPPPKLRPDLRRGDGLGLDALTLDVKENVCGWVDGDMRKQAHDLAVRMSC